MHSFFRFLQLTAGDAEGLRAVLASGALRLLLPGRAVVIAELEGRKRRRRETRDERREKKKVVAVTKSVADSGSLAPFFSSSFFPRSALSPSPPRRPRLLLFFSLSIVLGFKYSVQVLGREGEFSVKRKITHFSFAVAASAFFAATTRATAASAAASTAAATLAASFP